MVRLSLPPPQQIKNSLDTGTLGFTDIHNEADFKTQHSGISISGAGSFGDQFKGNMPGGMISVAGNSGHAEGTTQAAIANGTITIRDKDNQKQDVANLSRDTENANDSISPIFDKEKEQKRLQIVQAISDIGGQVADIARTQGELNATKTAKERMNSVKPEDRDAAKAQWEKANPGKTASNDDINGQVYQNYYNEAFNATGMGTGGAVQRGIQAATAALQGLAGGNLAGALAGASAPELANFIGHNAGINDNDAAKAIAHAILGGVTAALQGNSAASGAAGAASGELIAGAIAKALYPDVKDLSTLTEDQKQTLSTLASISSGMAGGIAGGNIAGVATGASAGKNAVENNLVAGSEDAQAAWIRQHGIDMASCSYNPSGAECQKAKNERDSIGLALAGGGVALLPGSAQAMWALGTGANAGISYLADGTIDPANAAIAGWVNVISMGNGLAGTVGWNAAGGAFGNWIDDKDPISGAASNGIGSLIGYGAGKGITWGTEKVTNAVGKWATNGWDPKFDPTWIKYAEVNRNDIIREGMKPSNVPGFAGDVGGSIGSELGGKVSDKIIGELKK
ncbi:Possible hemagglutinin (DUF638) [Raoultella terrigena]|uniref:Possible hemagglutinin (DUF638) n=1 Tax=Raoultella terrigena TaxID=577 RepID=A0A3P8M432_RAOTE|nr:Possible hemagglutinin (DUF638) [Raoultella terrigena]